MKKNKNINDTISNPDSITFKDFINYLENHSLLIIATILILFLSHGYLLFNNNIGVDTDLFITEPENNYNWLENGRYGLILEKYFLNLSSFNIFFAEILFILFLIIFCLVTYYTFYKISGKDFNLINLCIPLIGFTHPIFAEQFIFLLQSAEISFSLLLTILSILFIYKWIIDKKNIYAILNIILLTIILGSYQSFFIIYISFCLFAFILLCENENFKFKNNKDYWFNILKLLGTFILSFIIYQIIIRIFSSNFNYLNQMNFWKTTSKLECFKNIYNNFKAMILCASNYYNYGFHIGLLSILIIGIYNSIKTNKVTNVFNKIIYYMVYFLFTLSPFVMTIYIGSAPPMRSQFYIPLIEALSILFLTYYLCKNDKIKILKIISFIIIFILFLKQAYTLQKLYYADYLTRQNDLQTAYQLLHDISEYGVKENDKIYFYGHLEEKINPSALGGEIIATSSFETGYTAEPLYWHSTYSILRLFKSLGYNYNPISQEQVTDARINTGFITQTWPQENCILKVDDYYIIKLADYET